MSASDWRPCPRCAERVEKAFEKAKNHEEIEYETVEKLEELKNAMDSGYPRRIDYFDNDISLGEIREVEKILDIEHIYPTEGNTRPVRIDRNILIKKDKLSLTYSAVCRNCQYDWSVNNEFQGEKGNTTRY